MLRYEYRAGSTPQEKFDEKVREVQTIGKTIARIYLEDSDWLIQRHSEQLSLGGECSLSSKQYQELLSERNCLRKVCNSFEKLIPTTDKEDVEILHENILFFNEQVVTREFVQFIIKKVDETTIVKCLLSYVRESLDIGY